MRKPPMLIKPTMILLVKKAAVRHFLKDIASLTMTKELAPTARIPKTQEKFRRCALLINLLEHWSLHSSDKSAQSTFPSHLLEIGR